MVINLDFDGTVVTHDYPQIGKDIGSQPVLKKLVAKGPGKSLVKSNILIPDKGCMNKDICAKKKQLLQAQK